MAYTTIDPILKHLANHFVAEIAERTKEGKDLLYNKIKWINVYWDQGDNIFHLDC